MSGEEMQTAVVTARVCDGHEGYCSGTRKQRLDHLFMLLVGLLQIF